MRRRTLLGGLSGSAVLPAWAQPSIPIIGVLATMLEDRFLVPMRRGLADGGYVEGRNLTMFFRSADGQLDSLPRLTADLVERQVSVILAWGTAIPARVAKATTTTIPIVFAYGGDPVADGLVPNLNSPGGNLTGVTLNNSALIPKRMELVRDVVPGVSDVALLVNSRSESLAQAQIRDAEKAAPLLGLRVHVVDVGSEADFDPAFATIERLKLGAVVVSTDPLFASLAGRQRTVALSAKHGLPTVYGGRSGPDAGGLMSYGTVSSDTWRRAGDYVARILKGAKPGDLPVIQGALFETVLNLKAAKALGLVIPTKVLAAADEVIE